MLKRRSSKIPNLQTLALTHPGLYFVAILNVLYYNVSKYTDKNKISTWTKFIALDGEIGDQHGLIVLR